MNKEDQENDVCRGPLIFTVPAYGFVMALYLDWLSRSYRGSLSTEAFTQEVDPIGPPRIKPQK